MCSWNTATVQLILCVNLTRSQGAQILGQTLCLCDCEGVLSEISISIGGLWLSSLPFYPFKQSLKGLHRKTR